MNNRKRWLALIVLCLGVLMIVLDTTIVNVALPSIKKMLGFSDASLVWVMNSYLLTYGGFLLLGGRLGDLYGHRRLFLIGLCIFTLASLACGISPTAEILIIARAVQGLGGAIVAAVSLSIIMNLFPEPAERARAMGFYGFVCAAGGSIGVLLGGILTGNLDWHWIFLVNIPIGIAVFWCCLALIPRTPKATSKSTLDLAGALTVTASLMLAVFAVVKGNEFGWMAWPTVLMLTGPAALLFLFINIEARVRLPLMPLRLFQSGNVATANAVGVLWAASMFAWFFLSAQYMQFVLGYEPLDVGLAFLPANIIMALLSLGVSAKLVTRFGNRIPAATGMLMVVVGLIYFARAPINGDFLIDILPGMILLGLGAGIAFNPVLMAAMNDVSPSQAGLASGMVNTSFMMGGALGLAVLASIADANAKYLIQAGFTKVEGLNSGFQLAFIVGSVFAGLASLLCIVFLRNRQGETESGQIVLS